MTFKKTDLIIPAVGLIAALLIFFIPALKAFGHEEGSRVVVYVDGEIYAELPLSEDADIVIPGAAHMNNRLVIRDSEADILSAGCPDKVCVHERKIRYAGETLVCLPNKVVVEIEGERGELDAVSK